MLVRKLAIILFLVILSPLCYRHPEAKLRINSYLISKALLKSDRALLPGTISAKDNEELSTTLGDFLDTSSHLYQDLQNTYLPVNNI